MDKFCDQILDSLDNNKLNTNGEMNTNGEVGVFRTCFETWETKKIGYNGSAIFDARLVGKYGSLKWLDPDNELSLRVPHTNTITFNKHWGNKKYNIFSTMEVCDINIPHESQSDFYDVWVTDIDF